MNSRAELRKSSFKSRGASSDELRRQREDASVELRKNKREDSLNKKRSVLNPILAGADKIEMGSDDIVPSSTFGYSSAASASSETPSKAGIRADFHEKLPQMLQGLYSSELDSQLNAAREFRKVLSKEYNPPIEDVIQAGVVPKFVDFLRGPVGQVIDPVNIPKYEKIQFESAWVLTNIASGTSQQTQVVVESGAIPIFISLLSSNNEDVKDQAVWALGNIAGDSPPMRNVVLNHGIVGPLIELIRKEYMAFTAAKASLLRNATWTLSNLTRGKPGPAWEQVAMTVPVFAELLNIPEKEVIADAAWGLSYLSDGDSDRINAILSVNVVPKLVALLDHESHAIQSPCLRVLGNIVTGDEYQTQAVIDSGILQKMPALLTSPKSAIQKEACWTISNITAGSAQQIQAVLEANLAPYLIRLLASADYKTKKEACWALSNATSARDKVPDQVRYLVKQGVIKPFCDILGIADSKVLKVALDAIGNILEIGAIDAIHYENVNPYAIYIEEAGGLDKIFELQNHENLQVYKLCKNIIDKHFSADEEEGIVDDNQQQEGFHFQNENLSVPHGGFQF